MTQITTRREAKRTAMRRLLSRKQGEFEQEGVEGLGEPLFEVEDPMYMHPSGGPVTDEERAWMREQSEPKGEGEGAPEGEGADAWSRMKHWLKGSRYGEDHQAQHVDAEDLWDAHEVMHGREPEHGGGPITEGVEEIEGGDVPALPGMGATAPSTTPPTQMSSDSDDEDDMSYNGRRAAADKCGEPGFKCGAATCAACRNANKEGARRKAHIGMRITAISNGRVAEGIVLELLPLGDLMADFGGGAEEVAGDLVLEPELDLGLDLDLEEGDDEILDVDVDELLEGEEPDEGEAEEEEEACEDCGHTGCPLDCPDDCDCISDEDTDEVEDEEEDGLFGDLDLDDVPPADTGGGGGEQMVLVITVDDAMSGGGGDDDDDSDPFIP